MRGFLKIKIIVLVILLFLSACAEIKVPVTAEEKLEAQVEIAVQEWENWYSDYRRVAFIVYEMFREISNAEPLKEEIKLPSKNVMWDDGVRKIGLKELDPVDKRALEIISNRELPKNGYVLIPLPTMPAENLIKPWIFAKEFKFNEKDHIFTYVTEDSEIKIPAEGFPVGVRFFVSMSKDINAYAAKDGDGHFIMFHRGICQFLPDDNQLAFVIGHEMSHVLRGHLGKLTGTNLLVGILSIGVAIATGIPDLGNIIYGGIMAKYSRDHEREADFFGLCFTHLAGYDIEVASKAFITLGSSAPPIALEQFFSTHPYDAERRAYLKKVVNWVEAGKSWHQIIEEIKSGEAG